MRIRKPTWRFSLRTGLVGAALILAIFIISISRGFGYWVQPPQAVIVCRGVFYWGSWTLPDVQAGAFTVARTDLYEWPRWYDLSLMGPLVLIPLWYPFFAFVLLAVIAWLRVRQQQPHGHCESCGYNLTGNTTGRCPECGTNQRGDRTSGLSP